MAMRKLSDEEKQERRMKLLEKIMKAAYQDVKLASNEANYEKLNSILECISKITKIKGGTK